MNSRRRRIIFFVGSPSTLSSRERAVLLRSCPSVCLDVTTSLGCYLRVNRLARFEKRLAKSCCDFLTFCGWCGRVFAKFFIVFPTFRLFNPYLIFRRGIHAKNVSKHPHRLFNMHHLESILLAYLWFCFFPSLTLHAVYFLVTGYAVVVVGPIWHP